MAFPVQSLPDGTVRWSDGSVTGGMSTNQGQVSTQSSGPTQNTWQPQDTGPDLSNPDKVTEWERQQALNNQNQAPDPYQLLQDNWNAHLSGLDAQQGLLESQRGAQEQQVIGAAGQAQNTLDLQRTQSEQQLGRQRDRTSQNETKTLRDLSGNIQNAMRAGGIYLGSLGAGDSSAANQYSYALTKLGTRERSNVKQNTANIFGEIDARETDLNNQYNTETRNLELEKNNNLQQIAQWFANAQMTIQQQKSQDRQALSQQILDQALSAINSVNQQVISRQQALDQWALNSADSIQQAKSNLQQVSNFNPTLPQSNLQVGTPQLTGGNLSTNVYGGGFASDDESRLFGGR